MRITDFIQHDEERVLLHPKDKKFLETIIEKKLLIKTYEIKSDVEMEWEGKRITIPKKTFSHGPTESLILDIYKGAERIE